MNISERIRARRQELNISQTELAKLVNVHANTIIRWESGSSLPKGQKVAALESVLQTSLASFVPLRPKTKAELREERRIKLLNQEQEFTVEVRYSNSEAKEERAINEFSYPFLSLANDLFRNPAIQAEFAAWQAKRAAKEVI